MISSGGNGRGLRGRRAGQGMSEVRPQISGTSARRFADFLLFAVTLPEPALLFHLTPAFSLAACLSLASLLTPGRWFGVRPALRGLATGGPCRLLPGIW
jgi:hypothetical protein